MSEFKDSWIIQYCSLTQLNYCMHPGSIIIGYGRTPRAAMSDYSNRASAAYKKFKELKPNHPEEHNFYPEIWAEILLDKVDFDVPIEFGEAHADEFYRPPAKSDLPSSVIS